MVKRDGLLLSIVLVLSVSMSNLWPQGGHAMPFALKTTAFSAGESIPKKYTCDGSDLSPALTWTGIPTGTQSLALIADDPDAPVGTWTHWIIWNIPTQGGLPEGLCPSSVTASKRSSMPGMGGPTVPTCDILCGYCTKVAAHDSVNP